MIGTFYIYTDSEGKLPGLFYKPIKSLTHRPYVKYVGNQPVECLPHNGQDKAWDYKLGRYVSLESIKLRKP